MKYLDRNDQRECELCGDEFVCTAPNQKYCPPCGYAMAGVPAKMRDKVAKKLKREEADTDVRRD
jgi:hypothetical protein